MPRFHLVQSQTPLSEGRDQTTMCGRNLEKPIFGAWCDGGEFSDFVADEFINSLTTCQKCAAQLWNERYLYAVKER